MKLNDETIDLIVEDKIKILLSDHFSLNECCKSSTAKKYGIPNVPTDTRIISNMSRAASEMERVRKLLGTPLIVTSGFRSEEVNRRIGGSHRSQHCFGLAIDFKPMRMNLLVAFKIIMESIKSSSIDQLILEDFKHIIHLSVPFEGKEPRRQVLRQLEAGQFVPIDLNDPVFRKIV